MLGIADYFWRLIPANPILLRVVSTAGKRTRDLLTRCIYLGLLVVIVIFTGASSGGGDLSQLAKSSATLFQSMSYIQLALVALLAPVYTAGAITQEKDSQTYDILLTTPLTNGQIVLGTLLSRLFFVVALLISGIPIFATTQIFGGVAINSIVQSFFIAAATAWVTGALAIAIAVLKVGSRRTIFGFYLFLVAYVVLLYILDSVQLFKIAGHQVTNATSQISWVTGLQPFLALRSILHDPTYTPPLLGDLPESLRGWPFGWYFTDPAGFYTTLMFTLGFILVIPSVITLRHMAQSTTNWQGWILQTLRLSKGERTRKPRAVWNNPVAWREAKTKGSATRATLLRWSFIVLGVGAALVLAIMYSSLKPATASQYVDRNSYDPQTGMLTVYAAKPDAQTQTLRIDPSTQINLKQPNGSFKSIGIEQIDHRMQIDTGTSKDAAGQDVSWTALNLSETPRVLDESQTRSFLLGATAVELAVILLIITNVAASTVTREKEDGTLDILLSTPITSRFYIWGKLRGLVSFALPLVAVPVASVGLFVLRDAYASVAGTPDVKWIAVPEALLILPATLVITCAFASIVGMTMSLRARRTIVAVMSSVAIVAGLCGVIAFCGYSVLSKNTQSDLSVGAVIGSFSPFMLLAMQINPGLITENSITSLDTSDRTLIFVFGWIAVVAYTALVLVMYRSMVKNFDMTIRKQSR